MSRVAILALVVFAAAVVTDAQVDGTQTPSPWHSAKYHELKCDDYLEIYRCYICSIFPGICRFALPHSAVSSHACFFAAQPNRPGPGTPSVASCNSRAHGVYNKDFWDGKWFSAPRHSPCVRATPIM